MTTFAAGANVTTAQRQHRVQRRGSVHRQPRQHGRESRFPHNAEHRRRFADYRLDQRRWFPDQDRQRNSGARRQQQLRWRNHGHAGTLDINGNNALGSGTLTIAGGNLGNTNGNAVVLGNIPQVWSNSCSYAGGNLLDLGTGPVTVNSSVGTVSVNSGTLQVGGNLNSGSYSGVIGTGTLLLTGSDTFSAAAGANALQVFGNMTSTGTVSFPSGYSMVQAGGTYTISYGSVTASMTNAFILGNLTLSGVADMFIWAGPTIRPRGGSTSADMHQASSRSATPA